MGFLGFGKPQRNSTVLIDVAGDSVGGACAIFEKDKAPALVYAKRIAIEPRAGEAANAAFSRALAELGDGLIREGAPALMRASGTGRTDRVIAAIQAPWAESKVHIERLQAERDTFIFTTALLAKTLKEPENLPAERISIDETVLATYLDGYESRSPVGERAHRVSVIALSTTIDRAIAEPLAATLRSLYHTHQVSFAPGALAFYRGLEVLFPHETDYLALGTNADVATLLLVRKGTLLAVSNLSLASDPAAALENAFAELSRTQPLPRSVFLVTEESARESLKNIFADKRFAPLWLSDDPPRVLPVLPEHLQLGAKLSLVGDAQTDIRLALLTLYCAQESVS